MTAEIVTHFTREALRTPEYYCRNQLVNDADVTARAKNDFGISSKGQLWERVAESKPNRALLNADTLEVKHAIVGINILDSIRKNIERTDVAIRGAAVATAPKSMRFGLLHAKHFVKTFSNLA